MPALMNLIYAQPGLQTEIHVGVTQLPIVKHFMFPLLYILPHTLYKVNAIMYLIIIIIIIIIIITGISRHFYSRIK